MNNSIINTTSGWQKYTSKILCSLCKKRVATWICIPVGNMNCNECVPRISGKTPILKENIDPIWNDRGHLINLSEDFEYIDVGEYACPPIGWQILENGVPRGQDPYQVLLKQYILNIKKCPECFNQLYNNYAPNVGVRIECNKCNWKIIL